VTEPDFDRLVAEHAAGWLADAVCLCRVLDWRGYRHDETLHAINAATLPEEASRHCLAWTAPGLRPLVAEQLHDRRSGPVVVIDVAAVVKSRHAAPKVTDAELLRLGQLETQQICLHEFAHVREQESRGVTPPEHATLPLLLAAVAERQSQSRHDRGHGLQWLRCYVHLSHRATEFWPWQWWLDVGFSSDVAAHGLGAGRDFADVLEAELVEAANVPLVDILRSDPPPAFTALYESRVALRDAARLAA